MSDYVDQTATWVPSSAQETLLKIALAPAGEALDAGVAWLESLNLATQEEALNRLLPLMHDKLLRDGVDHPAMRILQGVRRKVWCRNQVLFKHAVPAVQALCDAGIDVMLLKGTVLTLNYYEDYGLRSMGDFDLMVRLTDVVAAIAILKENGWKMRDGICDASMHGVLGQNILRYNHAEHFINDSRQNLDLHWHLLDLCLETNADDSFWDASIAGKFDSIDVRLLNPADQLLHVCVHGLMWSDVPGIRWIPDSLAIIRKVPTLDWNRLLIQAQDRDLRLFVRSALNYLVSRFSAPVPPEVMLAVNALPAEADEAREFAVFTGSRSFNSTKIEKEYSILKTLRVRFYIFKRIAASAKLSGIKIGVWGYLSAVCRMDNGWRTFVYILYRFAKMASRSVRRVIFDSFESLTTG